MSKLVPVHNVKILLTTTGHSTNLARITVDITNSAFLLSNSFWPRPVHCRIWHFKETIRAACGIEDEQHDRDKTGKSGIGTPLPEEGSAESDKSPDARSTQCQILMTNPLQ